MFYEDEDEEVVLYDMYGSEIYEGDYYYDINGEIISEKNMGRWLKEYKHEAEPIDSGDRWDE